MLQVNKTIFILFLMQVQWVHLLITHWLSCSISIYLLCLNFSIKNEATNKKETKKQTSTKIKQKVNWTSHNISNFFSFFSTTSPNSDFAFVFYIILCFNFFYRTEVESILFYFLLSLQSLMSEPWNVLSSLLVHELDSSLYGIFSSYVCASNYFQNNYFFCLLFFLSTFSIQFLFKYPENLL